MSSAVVSTSAALGRPFLFDADPEPAVCPQDAKKLVHTRESVISQVLQSTLKKQSTSAVVTPASRLEIRPAPEMVSSGIAALDSLTGGLPRGCLTEICGPASSGRTSIMLAALAAATRRGEFCALLDASDTLDPKSAATAGIDLDRFLWVRCGEDSPQKHQNTETANVAPARYRNAAPDALAGGRASRRTSNESEHRLDQVLRATDLLLESGGFGLIVLDLADLPTQSARRIPLTTWFRFRRAIEHTPAILLTIEQHPIAGSCSSLLLELGRAEESAAERRQITAHSLPRASRGGASRGFVGEDQQAPEGRKKMSAQPELDLPHPAHAQLFTGLNITAELIRSRLDRKPARSIAFATKTAWAG